MFGGVCLLELFQLKVGEGTRGSVTPMGTRSKKGRNGAAKGEKKGKKFAIGNGEIPNQLKEKRGRLPIARERFCPARGT